MRTEDQVTICPGLVHSEEWLTGLTNSNAKPQYIGCWPAPSNTLKTNISQLPQKTNVFKTLG